MYDELENVEWRQYTGLDDKTLNLLEKVDVASLSEANLDFASVQFMFLPDELERAEAAFNAARSTAAADHRWVAGLEQYELVLDALETSRAAYKIGNSATALGVILAVFERHVGELAEAWFDADTRCPSRKGTAPLETVFGVREIPVETAVAVGAAIDRLVQGGTVDGHVRHRRVGGHARDVDQHAAAGCLQFFDHTEGAPGHAEVDRELYIRAPGHATRAAAGLQDSVRTPSLRPSRNWPAR